MDLGLAGKRALVFGSTSGIGRGIAGVLIEEGAEVVITGRGGPRLAETAELVGAAGYLAADLDEPGAGARAVADASEQLGGLDILITNGGGPPKSTFLTTDDDAWRSAIQQVLLGAAEPIRAALPAMIAAGWGRVILITSSTGRESLASNILRPALHGLVNSLSKEVAANGVTVNALMPGMVETPRIAELGLANDALTASIPAGRLAQPAEIGSLAAFLASEKAAYLSGQAIACDGARLAAI